MIKMKLGRSYIADTMLAFKGVFTGVMGSLLKAGQTVEYSLETAMKIAEEVNNDPQDLLGAVIPTVTTEEDKVIITYVSRSGNTYVWTFVSDWYENTFEFQKESSLSGSFFEVQKSFEEYVAAQNSKRGSSRR